MRHRILATVVLPALLAGCQASAPAPTPTALLSVAPSPSPTPEPAPSSEPEPSLSDDLLPAYQTVHNYLAAYDEWGANPTNGFATVTKYTIDDAEAQTLTMLGDQMKSVARVTGEPIYRGWSVRLIDPLLDGTAQASVKVCSDNAKMTLEHNDGSKSLQRGPSPAPSRYSKGLAKLGKFQILFSGKNHSEGNRISRGPRPSPFNHSRPYRKLGRLQQQPSDRTRELHCPGEQNNDAVPAQTSQEGHPGANHLY